MKQYFVRKCAKGNKKKMVLSKYKTCNVKVGERAIIDILLVNDLLIFSKNELINDEIIFCRSASEFENRYLRHEV